MILGEGLEEIGDGAFEHCTLFQRIVIPTAVKVIKNSTFNHCMQLTTVNLGEGLEEI